MGTRRFFYSESIATPFVFLLDVCVELPYKMGPKTGLPIEREGLIDGNPEQFYTFGDEIGTGKYAVTRHVTHKISGEKYAAKIIKYDDDDLKFRIAELDFMKDLGMEHAGLVKLHEAYLCRKYLTLIMECADGATLLDYVCGRHTLNEDVVASYIKQLCEVLEHLHQKNAVHLDLRPTNIRFNSSNILKLVDYSTCKFIANKKAGAVVDVLGDTEFCPVFSPPQSFSSLPLLSFSSPLPPFFSVLPLLSSAFPPPLSSTSALPPFSSSLLPPS